MVIINGGSDQPKGVDYWYNFCGAMGFNTITGKMI